MLLFLTSLLFFFLVQFVSRKSGRIASADTTCKRREQCLLGGNYGSAGRNWLLFDSQGLREVRRKEGPCVCKVVSVVSDSLQHRGLWLLCPWDFPGKNTAVGSMPSSMGSSQPRELTQVVSLMSFPLTGEFFPTSATWEAQ